MQPAPSHSAHQSWMEVRAAAFHVVGHLFVADWLALSDTQIDDALTAHRDVALLCGPAAPVVVLDLDTDPTGPYTSKKTSVPVVPALLSQVPHLRDSHDAVMGGVVAEALAWSLGDVDRADQRVARRRLGTSYRPTSFDGWLRYSSWRDRCLDDGQTSASVPLWLTERSCLARESQVFDPGDDVFDVYDLAGLIHGSWSTIITAAGALATDNSLTLGQARAALRGSH